MMQQLFSSPLFVYDDGIPNEPLLSEILEIQKQSPDAGRNHSGEWRSAHDFHRQNGEACQQLNLKFRDVFDAVLRELVAAGYRFTPRPPGIEAWVNINPPGSFIAPHCHPGARFCGTYYVKAAANCGALELQAGEGTTPFPLRHKIEPREGMFVIFPAYIYHWVPPNRSNDSRVSVSWNVGW